MLILAKSVVCWCCFLALLLVATCCLLIPLAAVVTPSVYPKGIHPVVRDNILLGGVLQGRLVNDEKIVNAIKGKEKYRCYRNHVFQRMATGSKIEEGGSETRITLAKAGEYDIAICGNWNAVPRKPKRIATTTEDRAAVLALLRAHRLKHPKVRITAEYAVDLDGNGTIEHVICATTPNADFTPHGLGASTIKKDDYSLVMITTMVKGVRKSIFVEGNFYPRVSDLNIAKEYYFGGCYDIDGDGKLEVLVNFMNSEEIWGSTIYRFTGSKAINTGLEFFDS